MSKRFINRDQELAFLNNEYNKDSSSLVIIYGRRRIGKTALIKNFIQNKPALYFLTSEEMESQNISTLKNLMLEFTGNPLLEKDYNFTWDRKEYYILFSKSGFTLELLNLAKERKDLKCI